MKSPNTPRHEWQHKSGIKFGLNINRTLSEFSNSPIPEDEKPQNDKHSFMMNRTQAIDSNFAMAFVEMFEEYSKAKLAEDIEYAKFKEQFMKDNKDTTED